MNLDDLSHAVKPIADLVVENVIEHGKRLGVDVTCRGLVPFHEVLRKDGTHATIAILTFIVNSGTQLNKHSKKSDRGWSTNYMVNISLAPPDLGSEGVKAFIHAMSVKFQIAEVSLCRCIDVDCGEAHKVG